MKKYSLLALAAAILLNAITWLLVFVSFPDRSDAMVLHYNIYFGIDLVGPWQQLLMIPISGTASIVVNTGLVLLFSKKAGLLSSVLEFSAVLIQVILLTAVLLLIPVNTI